MAARARLRRGPEAVLRGQRGEVLRALAAAPGPTPPGPTRPDPAALSPARPEVSGARPERGPLGARWRRCPAPGAP